MAKKIVKKNNSENTKHIIGKKKFAVNIPWWASLIIIIVACTALYYPVINYGLVECDDHEIIFRDYDRISKIENWSQEFFKSYMYNSYYRPIVTISFMLNAKMSGQESTSYHLTNLIVHSINACLVFYLFYLLGYKKLLPLLGGLIYAVHPVFTNAVAWLAGRNDLLLAMFFLSSFIFLVLFNNKKKLYYLILHFLTFLLALFSKETAVFASLLFFAYIFLIEKNKIKERTTILTATAWVFGIAIWYIFHSMAELGEPVYKSGFDVLVYNLRVIPEFMAKFFLPVHLSVLPTYSLLNTAIGLAIVLIIFYTIFRITNTKKQIMLFGAFWFLIIIAPGMFMTLLNSHEWNEYLECRGYLAMIGLLFIIFEQTKEYFEKNEKTIYSISIIIICILSYLSYNESKNYVDAPSYYESAVSDDETRASFQFLAGQVNLNNRFKKTNDTQYLIKAADYMKSAIALRPNHEMYYRTLAAVYSNLQDYEQAIPFLEKALALDSNQIDTYNGLGFCYNNLGRNNEAIGIWKLAYNKWQENQVLLFNLAVFYFNEYKSDSALFYVNKSYELDKGEKNLYEIYFLLNNWGGTYIENKFYQEGVGILKIAAELDPKRYAAYENLMNYYLLVDNRPDSAAYFAKKLIERGRDISPKKLEFLKPFMN